MDSERILAQIYGEMESLKRKAEQKTENLAYQHAGSGAPAHTASEGVFYWDYTNDNLYVNSDGSTTWQSIGGAVAGAHVLLSATHTDTTAASVTRGALVVGLGASPTWTRRDHPGGINYYLRSNAADPDWTSDLTLAAGAYVGRTGDVRVEFDSAAGRLNLILGDNAGSDQVRVLDSDDTVVAYVDSSGESHFTRIGVVVEPNALHLVFVQDTALSWDDGDYRVLEFEGEKTGGATDEGDTFHALYGEVNLNQAAGTIGKMYGAEITVTLTDGSVGSVGTPQSARGAYFYVDLNGGTVWDDAIGGQFVVHQAGANTVNDDIVGAYLEVDADGTCNGSVFMLYARVRDNVDWMIYQAQSEAPSFLYGDLKIGNSDAASAQLHVDQWSASGSQPVLMLDQGDVSEEFIHFQGTAASGVLTQSLVNYGDESTSTAAVWIKVEVTDDGDQVADQAYYVLGYTLA